MTADTPEILLERISQLQQRLDEAEETLRAWRSGEVDALVTSGPVGDCVYTLNGADKAYRLMVQTMSEGGVLMLTLDGVILFSNQQFASMLGLPLERVIGSSFRDCVAPEDAHLFAQILDGSAGKKTAALLKRANGTRIPAQISANPLVFDGIESVCLIVTDLSELRESEERYRLLVESVKDYAIVMLDPNGLVASWTSAAQKIKGYSAEEILGKSFECFYTKADIDRGHSKDMLKRARQDGQSEEDGWRVRKDGSLFWANASITALTDHAGAVRGFSKVTRDISVRKRIEDELIAERRRAEDANRSKSDFLATISHEIRTPMNAILGMAELLWDTELSHTQREFVGRFRRAGTNLLTLINDILDLSKIESGRFELESVEFRLSDLLEQTMDLMKPRATLSNLDLKAQIDFETPAVLVGDPTRLQQILTNVIGNAIKFTEKGSVTLTVEPHPDKRPAHLRFTVKDTGIGIPEDKLTSIFQDFTQAHSSTTRRFGGTGLGLGISRKLVGHMGGQLTVESVLGQGSTFVFDAVLSLRTHAVPLEKKKLSDLAGPSSGPVADSKEVMKILIADDFGDNRFLLAAYLNDLPYELTFAEDGQEAFEAFANHKFDIILMDIQMPGMDGLAATSSIRALERRLATNPTPIIALTAAARIEDAEQSKAAGCNTHLSKPISKEKLIATIEGFRPNRIRIN